MKPGLGAMVTVGLAEKYYYGHRGCLTVGLARASEQLGVRMGFGTLGRGQPAHPAVPHPVRSSHRAISRARSRMHQRHAGPHARYCSCVGPSSLLPMHVNRYGLLRLRFWPCLEPASVPGVLTHLPHSSRRPPPQAPSPCPASRTPTPPPTPPACRAPWRRSWGCRQRRWRCSSRRTAAAWRRLEAQGGGSGGGGGGARCSRGLPVSGVLSRWASVCGERANAFC